MKRERFTLPGETGMEEEIKKLIDLWGVDAIRDSDGTKLSPELTDMGLMVYKTLCLVRNDNEWIKKNPDCIQQIYLVTEEHTAFSDELSIGIMDTFFDQQFKPNTDVDIKKYWSVSDTLTGENVDSWTYTENKVVIKSAKKYHTYTVTFLAYQIWEPVSMYNHITNNWTSEHELTLDPRSEKARTHILERLDGWLKENSKTNIVRFTTFFYCFDLIYNQLGKEKIVNWFGYASCISPSAMEQFKKEYGYSLTPNDIADFGRYNTPFKNPTKAYLDFIDFNSKFVSELAHECVNLVHLYNKKAIMFLGDHWAGVEPYGKYFKNIGLDAVVGAAGDGVTTRMISDIPVPATEARFYPYFFPDVFCEGGDPVGESLPIWIKCRRAMMVKPTDRMGYGGYLSLALKFPEFIDHVTMISRQFKEIHEYTKGEKPHTASFKIAILNSWGHLKSWQTHQVAHSLWNQRCYSYLGVMESLAGLNLDIDFIDFSDVLDGKLFDYGVVLNMGDAKTAWSGDDNWSNPQVASTIREYVAKGGGFIGIGEPTAFERNGKLFTLSDVLGVQKEIGLTSSQNKLITNVSKEHFITADVSETIDYGEGMNMIYSTGAEILDVENKSVSIATNNYGIGKSVYIAGLPYSNQNARLLTRAIYYAAGKENEMLDCYCENINTDCHVYLSSGVASICNNSNLQQKTVVHLNDREIEVSLSPVECKWIKL